MLTINISYNEIFFILSLYLQLSTSQQKQDSFYHNSYSMLFNDKLVEISRIIGPEFKNIFQLALKSQKYPGDLLLFHVNGFYDEYTDSIQHSGTRRFDPHVIGLGREGHSEADHYNFIHHYRTTNVLKIPYQEHVDNVKWDQKRKKEIETIVRAEELSIQVEMLIYLKIWESDSIIKKLYELAQILLGKPYDWYFKIGKGNGKYNYFQKRHEIMRKHIRDAIQGVCPTFSQILKDTYKSQVRNAIAHSQYWFLNRQISLNNYDKNDPGSTLHSVSFDEWVDMFHNTLNIHNQLIWLSKTVNEHYAKIANENDNKVLVRITEKDGYTYDRYLYYRDTFQDWGWYPANQTKI